MIEATDLKYKVIIITERGKSVDLSQAVKQLSWSEAENEISTKITFKLVNDSYDGLRLSAVIKLCTKVYISAEWGSGKGVVASGSAIECEPGETNGDCIFDITAYGKLYQLQRSQDYIYFPEGKTTPAALGEIFGAFGVTFAKYTGPNVTHGELVYKSSYIGDIGRKILAEAKRKGGCKAIIRESPEGEAECVAIGGNNPIYQFTHDNSTSVKHKVSISDLVTRVKVLSTNPKQKNTVSVDAVIDGQTKYGIFQRVKVSSSSDDKGKAKQEAQDMITEKGEPQETCPLVTIDVPPVRKGDLVHCNVGTLNGFFAVKSVTHDADARKMTMQLEKWKVETQNSNTQQNNGNTYKVNAASGLHIRTGPNARILGVIPYNSTVQHDGQTNGSWLHVTWNGISGYCYSKYLTKT